MRITGYENNITLAKEFGQRLQDLRLSMNYSQEDLASKAGVSKSTVLRAEKGDFINIEKILNILRALDLIENLELLIPEWQPSPEMYYKNLKKRQRAGKKKEPEPEREMWGDKL